MHSHSVQDLNTMMSTLLSDKMFSRFIILYLCAEGLCRFFFNFILKISLLSAKGFENPYSSVVHHQELLIALFEHIVVPVFD